MRLASLDSLVTSINSTRKVQVPSNNLRRTGSYSKEAEEGKDHGDTETPDWDLKDLALVFVDKGTNASQLIRNSDLERVVRGNTYAFLRTFSKEPWSMTIERERI